MMTRIFHPIGQGAFYTERFKKINLVYDCGVLPNKKTANKVVRQSFKSGEEIDILVISHFDADHVNKIKILKKRCGLIKNVFLPLLNDNNKIIINIYKALNLEETANLIEAKNSVFDDETNIIRVKPSEYQQKGKEINKNPMKIQELKKKNPIESGTVIRLSSDKNWCFIPYNYEYLERKKELVKKLESKKLDIKEIEENLDYALANRGMIRDVYNSLKEKINLNSMLLYSGPMDSRNNLVLLPSPWYCISHYHYNPHYMHECLNRVGCIYTGDTDFNVVKINEIFEKNYRNNVGTIQIPHHGSINEFNEDFFDKKTYFCPISAGKNSIHGHPSSSVIASILSNNSFPIIINESPDSRFIQTIYRP